MQHATFTLAACAKNLICRGADRGSVSRSINVQASPTSASSSLSSLFSFRSNRSFSFTRRWSLLSGLSTSSASSKHHDHGSSSGSGGGGGGGSNSNSLSSIGNRSIVQNPSFKVASITFDGQVTVENFQTPEILKAAQIYARDLFLLNVTSRQERHRRQRPVQRSSAVILPRKDLIIVSFGNVRAVVGLEKIFLMDAHQPVVLEFAQEIGQVFREESQPSQLHNTPTQSAAAAAAAPAAEAADVDEGDAEKADATKKQHNVKNADASPSLFSTLKSSSSSSSSSNGGDPPELLFLDEVLRDTVDSFSRRLRLYEPIVDNFLDKVSHEVYSDTGVHQLVPLKDSLQSFEIQVRQSVDCLASLLNDDEMMLDLLLTEQAAADKSGSPVDYERHEHVEILLGVYARQLSSIRWEVQYLLGRLESKREFVSLALASYRNRLVRMNVHLGIFTMSLAVGTTMSGFFGMNLINGMENVPGVFPVVVAASVTSGALIALYAMNYMSGHTMQKRAESRLKEIETLNAALSDMSALDYTLKTSVGKGISVSKADFRRRLRRARESQFISDNEVNLLFSVFDRVRDGLLTLEEFSSDATARLDRNIDKERHDKERKHTENHSDGPV